MVYKGILGRTPRTLEVAIQEQVDRKVEDVKFWMTEEGLSFEKAMERALRESTFGKRLREEVRKQALARTKNLGDEPSNAEYWADVRGTAQEILLEAYKEYPDDEDARSEYIQDRLFREVEGSEWIIQDYRTWRVHEFSDNPDAWEDFGKEALVTALEKGEGVEEQIRLMASASMRADVSDVLSAYDDEEPEPVKGPGKYEGELVVDTIIHGDGAFDEEADLGGEGETDWYGSIDYSSDRGRFLSDLEKSAKEAGVDLTMGDKLFIMKNAGVVYHEDNQGFVSSEWFEDADDIASRWKEIQEAEGEVEED